MAGAGAGAAARMLAAILLVWLPAVTTTSTHQPPGPPPPPSLGAHEELRRLTPATRASWQAGVETAILADLRRAIAAHAARQSAASPAAASGLNSENRPPGPRGRPFVTLTWAQSLDGCIAAADGSPVAISGAESLLMTHGLRAAHDAVLAVRAQGRISPRLSALLPPPCAHPPARQL